MKILMTSNKIKKYFTFFPIVASMIEKQLERFYSINLESEPNKESELYQRLLFYLKNISMVDNGMNYQKKFLIEFISLSY